MSQERVLAIDPGEVHCGMAEFLGLRCYHAYEVEPWECLDIVERSLRLEEIDVLVVEKFQLYASKAMSQAGSELGTVKLIGALEYLHRRHGQRVRLVAYPASNKKVIQGMLRAKNIPSEAKRSRAGGHALDAELHGYYYLLTESEDAVHSSD